jgi:hypothetical protein
MNTLDFLRAILPEEGYKLVGLSRAGSTGIGHRAFKTLEEMAEAITSFDGNESLTVYHACAAYKAPSYEVEVQVNGETKTKTKYRGEQNWFKAKSFWADIDCGEAKAREGKGYATKKEAADIIRGFCLKHGFPAPMIVDSGGGIHCYWPLTRSIGPNAWRTMATALKAAFAADGLIVDPSRTADLSSVLRPVGTHNRKPGRDVRMVQVKSQPNPVTPEEFKAVLNKITQWSELPSVRKTVDMSLNDDLTAHLGPQLESSADEAANHCAQLAAMRDTKGDVNYEHWRGVIGIIKHCVEGFDLALDWSSRRAETNHSNLDTDVKYETWTKSATKCDHFKLHNPIGCQGCPHSGKITSPIQLGRIVPESVAETVEINNEGETVETTIPPLPESYQFTGGVMVRFIKDKDGVLQPYTFCMSLFYPFQRIRKSDGAYAFTIRMHLPDHRVRDFDVDTSSISSPNDLLKALSKYELMPTNNKDASMHLTAYLRDSVRKLMNEQREIDTLTSFGWNDNMSGFLMGDRLYHRDGSVRKVFIGGAAADNQAALPEPRGTVEKYSEAVNFVYSRPDSEPAQYAFCNTYGSLLTPFGEESYNGVLFCIVSNQSGRGKTTVGLAARYGLGDANKLMFGGKSGATPNARWALLGAFKNIPVLFDEMTDMDAAQFSEMAYAISQGADKSRLTSSNGKIGFAEKHTWAQSPDLTANQDMLSKLAEHSMNSQAEAMRVVQLNYARYPVPIIDPATLVSRALEQMRDNMGTAGDVFLRYIVSHQKEVSDLFRVIENTMTKYLPESEYRFYRNHAACTLTAAKILINLKIVDFEYEALEQFAIRLLQDQITIVSSGNITTPADSINRMMRDLSNRILVTTTYRDLRTDARGPEESLSRIQGTPVGRRIIGLASPNTTERVDPKYVGKVFLLRKEINDWCSKNRVEPKELLDHAQLSGWIVKWPEKFNVGRGTTWGTGSHTVVVFDFDAMEGVLEKTGGPLLVEPINSAVSSTG